MTATAQIAGTTMPTTLLRAPWQQQQQKTTTIKVQNANFSFALII